jgi:hypothetical protein
MLRSKALRLVLAFFVGTVAAATSSAADSTAGADFHAEWARRVFSAAPELPDLNVPFSSMYAGRHSRDLLGKWKRTVMEEPAAGGKQRRTLTLTDPESGLEVRAVATVYADTPAVEWTLYFTNKGDKDTPVLEQVKAASNCCDSWAAPAASMTGCRWRTP